MMFAVEVLLTGPELWQATARAEKAGLTVGQYLAKTVGSDTDHPLQDSFMALYRCGLTDRQLSQRLNMTRSAVAFQRRKQNLPANREKKAAA